MAFGRSLVIALVLPKTLSSFLLGKNAPIVNGKEECPCIGMNGATNTTFPHGTKPNGTEISYSDETGKTCAQWDSKFDSACWVRYPPDWCKLKWCFVDPCACTLPTPPKKSDYFPDARLNGVPVWKSYATCGSGDVTTSTRACPNLANQRACESVMKPGDITQRACGWTGQKCLGKDLVDVCAK